MTKELAVTVTDNDETGLALSKASLGVTEGSSDTYTVKLATQPSADVTVDITGHSDTDLTLAPASASLTFTADDWDTAQTVTVQAGEDADATNDTATLLHTATGGDYDAVTKELAVTVTENDEAGLSLSKASLGVTEGSSDTYTVKLATQPSADVTVDITGHSGTDLTLAPASASLTFTADDWDTAQTVTVQAGEDDDATNDTATLLHTATGGDYDAVTKELAVTVTENDETGLTLSKASLGVTEGSSDTYTVKLATQPTAQVTVDITGHSGTDLTLAPASASLTFTADDWDTAQTVTVQAGQDEDKNDETVTLQHAATGGGYDAVTRNLAVTVHDDEASVPGAPNLEAAAGNESATLRWTPPADNGGSPVTSYKYRLGTSPAENTASMTSHTMHGLANGTEYRFQLQAENRVGRGPWSTAKSVTPRALTLTLEAVSDEVTEGEPVRYRIVISNPTTSWVNINEAFRYKGAFLHLDPSRTSSWIRFRRDDPVWEKQLATVDDAEIEAHGSFTVTLEPGDGYTVGTPSSATVRILDNDGGTAPGAPPRPAVSVVSPTMLDATWGTAAPNGAPITRYALEYRAGASGSWTRWPNAIAPDTRSVRLGRLSPGTEYQVRVLARNVRGESLWSETGSAKTAPDPEVRVSISARTGLRRIEGTTLVFTVHAAPAPTSALRVDLRVTETLEMLSRPLPMSVTVPAGQRSATFEVRTRNDQEDEGYSEVTAELLPSVRYVLGEARATYRVHDDEPDTERGRVLRPRVEAILDPARSPEEQALFEEPIMTLRFTWDPPTDVALAHVRGWLVEWAPVENCSEPTPTGRWPGGGFYATADTVFFYRALEAAHLRVSALLIGATPGPPSEPVCGDVAEPRSARGSASEPVVTGARIASAPEADGGWRAGDEIEAVVRFSEAVTVDTSGGTPTLAIVLGAGRREAVYAGGSDTTELVFRHEVGTADDGARDARVVAGGLSANGATIRNAAGVDAELGFALAPVVTSVAVEPDPDRDERWSAGEAVTVTFGFSEAVTVRTEDGTPAVSVLTSSGVRKAVYARGSGTTTLHFVYQVTATDEPVTSVLVPENSLRLHGGTIVGPSGLEAVLAHIRTSQAEPPAGPPSALSVADATAEESPGATLNFAITLDRAPTGTVSVDWATSDGTAKAGSDYTEASGRLIFLPGGARSKMVRVAVLPDEESEGTETIKLTLSNASGATLADATATGTVSDPAQGSPAGPPPAISIADATVMEGPGATLSFAVTLDRASTATVTVGWETRDGSARAGEDYVGGSGKLSFAPGETAKTIPVTVLDDSHDEGREIMLVVLSNPVGATIAKAAAGGVIDNTDHLPQAWLARFGRTVAEQVLDAVEERIRSAPQAGVQVTVAGQQVDAGPAPSEEEAREAAAEVVLDSFSTWLRGEAEAREQRTGSPSVTPRELLAGSSFALTTGAEEIGGGRVSLWGRGALTRFDGREDELSLSGEVSGALLGADWTGERWTAGLLLSHAWDEGNYQGADSGKVSSTVTGLYPYGRYAATDRVTVWGAAGYGAGTLVLTPENGAPLETDMYLMMAAAGLRGTMVEAPPEGGPELAVKTDAMVVQTSSAATGGGAGGNLAAADAVVTRLRLGLEGTWRGLAIGTGTLTPWLELGGRHDGGDAETESGLDIGGGLAWSDPGTGIRAAASGRGLLTQTAGGFRQFGIAGSLGWDPTPGSDRGPSLTLSQTMGLSVRGGADALLGRTTLAELAASDPGSGSGAGSDELAPRRLELKLGYGFGAFGDRFTSTPELGLGISEGHREYSLGWRLVRDRRSGDIGSLEFSLEARRRESVNPGSGAGSAPEHSVGLLMTARF